MMGRTQKPAQAEVLRMLIERKPFCIRKAEEAEAAEQAGMAIYWRTLAANSDVLYAWMVGDDSRMAVAHVDEEALKRVIERMDEDVLNYRVSRACLAA